MTLTLKWRDHLDRPEKKKIYNEQLFKEVAPKYNFVTRALSLGRDRHWKESLIRLLPDLAQPRCLDLACGTGDLTYLLARKYPDGKIIGLDLTPEMIEKAKKIMDATERVPPLLVDFLCGDMCKIPYPDHSMDIVTGGYALRNAPDLRMALQEIHRVLKPGGAAAFLDFSKPRHRLGQALTYLILKCWGGFWGRLLHRNAEVYGYIAESLKTYPDRTTLKALIKESGFTWERNRLFYFGCVEIFLIKKY